MSSATATAHANIALIKYWGKRDTALNLPATGSLSLTLAALTTETTVRFSQQLDQDHIELNQQVLSTQPTGQRISLFLDLLYPFIAGTQQQRPYAEVHSNNNFPTAAGLASSASGFAALTLAAHAALDGKLSAAELSMLARRGSGSAARSIYGGFVEMLHGQRDDGMDCIARPLQTPEHWPLEVLIAITDAGHKKISSTAGMQRTTATSPFYPAWVAGAEADLATARTAIAERDFAALAAVTEFSTLKMHASALAAQPGVIYWNAATLAAMHCIRDLRAAGTPVCFTMDAGPQVKAVCAPQASAEVTAALRTVAGVIDIIRSPLGAAATATRHA